MERDDMHKRMQAGIEEFVGLLADEPWSQRYGVFVLWAETGNRGRAMAGPAGEGAGQLTIRVVR